MSEPFDVENPYQSPAVEEAQIVGVRSGRRHDLARVATYQKGVISCILITMIAMVVQLMLPPEFKFILAPVIFLVGFASTVFVILLALKVYSIVVGLLLGFFAFVPCIGLLVLLAVNAKATAILRQNGVEVGLLGARTAVE